MAASIVASWGAVYPSPIKIVLSRADISSPKNIFYFIFLCSELKYKYDARFMMGCGGVGELVQSCTYA